MTAYNYGVLIALLPHKTLIGNSCDFENMFSGVFAHKNVTYFCGKSKMKHFNNFEGFLN